MSRQDALDSAELAGDVNIGGTAGSGTSGAIRINNGDSVTGNALEITAFGSTDIKEVYNGEMGDYQTTKGHKADTKKGEWPFGGILIQESVEGCIALAAWMSRMCMTTGSPAKKGEWLLGAESSKKVPKVVFGSIEYSNRDRHKMKQAKKEPLRAQ